MKRLRLIARSFLVLAVCAAPPCSARGQINGAVTGTSLNVSTISTGTVLQVTPTASADRRYVEMSVNPQFSTLDGIDTFILSGTNGIVGGIAGSGRAAQPVAIRPVPFRPATVGSATFVDLDPSLLATNVKPLELRSVSLRDAMRKLAEVTKRNLVLGDRGLEQAGADLKSPHDFLLKPDNARVAFTMKDALLALAKTAMPDQLIVITSEDKVITVVSRDQADQSLVSKTYYLADLLANLPRFVPGGTDLNTLNQPADRKEPEKTSVSKDAAISKDPSVRPRPPASASTNILEVITSTVRPEIWKNHGGKADISQFGDHVTIKAPQYVHVLLEGPKAHNPAKVNSYVSYGQ
jgi:hypothetical protein